MKKYAIKQLNILFKEIGNHYVSLSIKRENEGELYEKYYWGIKYWSGYKWQEIPEYLYNALFKFSFEHYTGNKQG